MYVGVGSFIYHHYQRTTPIQQYNSITQNKQHCQMSLFSTKSINSNNTCMPITTTKKGQKAHNVVYIYPSSSPLNTLQPILTCGKPHKLFRIKMFQNFETNTQGKLKTINQSTASPESLLFPSKHVRSDSHLISISCEALA